MATIRNTIDYIIGMPPDLPTDGQAGSDTNVVMRNSMPVVKIYPGKPSFTKGLTLFTRKAHFRSSTPKDMGYINLLESHGYSLSTDVHRDCLTVAYQADSFPTDSFTNEYGENFLQSFTDVSSQAAASLSQIFGVTSAKQLLGKGNEALRKEGKIGELAADILGSGAEKATNVINSLPGGVASGIDLASRLMAGGRLDFPMVWKSSGFQPSYTMTVRLYNPNPGSKESTDKYIAAPVAALMLLGIPISEDGITYRWPFIHRIWSPGIYDLDPAFISNITVIKGGDQQQIGYNQRLGIVDVRIDFGSLFSSILATRTSSNRRPTLKKYVDGISGIDSEKPGIVNFSTRGYSEEDATQYIVPTTLSSTRTTKNQAPTSDELTTEEKQNPPDRISQAIKNATDSLLGSFPDSFKITIS
jgi:hypothetical protein